jgi:hypothetical protein
VLLIIVAQHVTIHYLGSRNTQMLRSARQLLGNMAEAWAKARPTRIRACQRASSATVQLNRMLTERDHIATASKFRSAHVPGCDLRLFFVCTLCGNGMFPFFWKIRLTEWNAIRNVLIIWSRCVTRMQALERIMYTERITYISTYVYGTCGNRWLCTVVMWHT